jgi:predicted nicotinamide N-methyase
MVSSNASVCAPGLRACYRRSVHDLPQLYTKPSASNLIKALASLQEQPASLTGVTGAGDAHALQIGPSGLPRYLTAIVSSPLDWIQDESTREQVWAAASARLSERSGRTAMPSMMRAFDVPISNGESARIQLYEPSLTSDNLGLKTWTSSALLSKRLLSLRHHLPQSHTCVLELGAGTGLVGLAAACAWQVDVSLTDLPDIMPNLQKNIERNCNVVRECGGSACALPLDWSDNQHRPGQGDDLYLVILAADPLYSPEHPGMLVDTVQRWLKRRPSARFIVELPLREGYHSEREDLKIRLKGIGMDVLDEGLEFGHEDWQNKSGEQTEVECWWAVWGYRASAPGS